MLTGAPYPLVFVVVFVVFVVVFAVARDVFVKIKCMINNILKDAGLWRSAITSASHAEGPGFDSRWVHIREKEGQI